MSLDNMENNLPNGWGEIRLVDILEYVTSGSRDWSKYYSDNGAAFIRTQDINTNRLNLKDVARVSLPEKVEGKRTRVYKWDILVTITGANVGKVALVESEPEESYVSQSVALIRLKDKSVGKFLHYQLISKPDGNKTQLESMAYGLGRPVLNLDNIREVKIRLAPKSEQTRIVAEIEKQFSRLDEAVANLKRVKANLKRYKAAVLKAAVEGKFTEEWRKQHPDVEPADKLLERILAERRKSAGKGKYKEPVRPKTSGLPKLPAGWVWARVEQVGQATTGFTPPTGNAEFFGGDIPFFKPTDLDAGYYTSQAREWLTGAGAERGRLLPAKSILVTCIGATIGKTGLARVDCTTNQQINALTVVDAFVLPEFVFWFFVSPDGQKQVIGNSSATTLPILNKSKFEALAIPLPPLAEQHQIVAEVERRLSIVAGAEAQVDANLRRADRLRQSILKQAFSGQLVPPHPSDEPASVLLERIRATQPTQTKEPGARQHKHRTPAHKTAAPSPEPHLKAAETPATYGDAIIARILAAMQPGREYARADLVEPLGLTTGQWNAAIQELKRGGRVRQVGEKRGARYIVSI